MSDNNDVPKTIEEAVATWRGELQSYLLEIQTFKNAPISEIFEKLSAWSGRAYYIRGKVIRSTNSSVKTFRTQEVDYFIQACDTQFKIWSRSHTAMKDEWEMSR